MYATSLPGRTGEAFGDRCFQAGVRVGDHQAHPGQAACFERAQELRPERLVFAVTDVEAEDLPGALGGDAGGDDHGARHDLAEGDISDMDVGGVQIHIGEGNVAQGAVTECCDAFVQPGADPGHFGLGDPGVTTQGGDQIIDRAGRHAVHVGLHDHRIQGLVDATTSFQQRREEAAFTQLGDLQVEVPGLGRQHFGAAAVAFGHPPLGAFITPRSDHRGRLSVDQRLQTELGQLTDQIGALTDIERGK